MDRTISKIDTYKKYISSNEQELISLRQRQDELLEEKSKLDKKGFFGKMIANKKINENKDELSNLKRQIEKLENKISWTKNEMKFEKENIKQITDNFLSNFGLNGMTLEDYKKRLEAIAPNAEKSTDPFLQKELEEKLRAVEQNIAEMQIDKQKEQQMRQALEQKKVEVGLSAPQILTNSMEELDIEKDTSISR